MTNLSSAIFTAITGWKSGSPRLKRPKKKAVYAADPPADLSYTFRGINLYRRTPDTLEVKASELHEVVGPQLAALTGAVRAIFEQMPPSWRLMLCRTGLSFAAGIRFCIILIST